MATLMKLNKLSKGIFGILITKKSTRSVMMNSDNKSASGNDELDLEV